MPPRSILVTGDFVVDHHIYEGRRRHYADRIEYGVQVRQQRGGAALVFDMLREVLAAKGGSGADQWSVHLGEHKAAESRAYAFWQPFPKKEPREKQFWRVSEAMGFGGIDDTQPREPRTPATRPPQQPDIVVLAEGGRGFRGTADAWPRAELAGAKWIVLKATAPAGEGLLWEHLTSIHRDRLVVVVSASELRESPARLSAGLSWEETIQNLLHELRPDGRLGALTRCRHLVVTFEMEGALWFDLARGGDAAGLRGDARVHFVHDAPVIEGDRAHGVEGTGIGFQSCMAAAVARQLTRDTPDLPAALEAGLAAMRDLLEKGHGPAAEVPSGFPGARLARLIEKAQYVYSRAVFPASAAAGASWTLVQQSQRKEEPVHGLARLVLLRGAVALANVPHLRVGNFLTADRREIEALRSLVQIMRRYQHNDAGKKPLSIGVFGPPGAGKSFAVRELANHVIGGSGWMEFNLSQFNSAGDLIGAFHQVRDQVLQGKLPVVFFDEFDAQSYRWLAPLLAPMQDGRFQDGQITHTLGKSIFVFAGGTSWTFETFGPPEPSTSQEDSPARRDFRLAKGPDFKSRFDGFLNVVGPNRRTNAASSAVDANDIYFPLRRALMIRAELRCAVDEKLDIDEGLVHALLSVECYKHGARSLGKILQPFSAARPGPLRRSLLAPDAQLDMHVDAGTFMRLCDEAPLPPYEPGDPLTQRQVGAIAPAIHETWRTLGRKTGWLKKESDKDFADLSDFLKDSNRAAAERMLENLGLVNLRLAEGVATAAEEEFIRAQLEYALETLAEAEHDGWTEWHLARGWRYAPSRDDENRLHPCLLPFRQLPKVDVDKDRDAVRHYPDFARAAGMKIVFADAVS